MAQSAPDWMMLDRFVYRKDNKEAFPDESTAPLRASSCTSLGKNFEVALLPANPPAISRFFVRWPGGTKPEEGGGVELVTTHLDLLLLRLTSIEKLDESPYICYTQDHFLCIASSDPKPHLQLKRLPLCREQVIIPPDEREGEDEETVLPLVFFPNTVGLVSQLENGSKEDGFVVALLAKVSQNPENSMMEAEVCELRSWLSSDDGDGRWVVQKIKIEYKEREFDDLWNWSTHDVVTFNKCICWVDYKRGGILFYDTRKENPTISYLKSKIGKRRTTSTRCQELPQMSRSLCVTRENVKILPMRGSNRSEHMSKDVLKFVDISRSDEYIFGPFELGSGFTMKSYTISSVDGGWVEEESTFLSSQDLWAANISSPLPHHMLMFPLASMLDNNRVHFLVSHCAKGIKKASVVTLDMKNKKVLAVDPYITGKEDATMIKEKSHLLTGFISSRFPMFLNSKRGKQKELKYTARMSMASASSA